MEEGFDFADFILEICNLTLGVYTHLKVAFGLPILLPFGMGSVDNDTCFSVFIKVVETFNSLFHYLFRANNLDVVK